MYSALYPEDYFQSSFLFMSSEVHLYEYSMD